MKVYFVRHGESKANAKRLHQDFSGGLSELGRKQAEFLAQRLKNIEIDYILSSPWERAKETADIINSLLNKPVELTDLLGELRNSSEIVGLRDDDPRSIEIRRLQRENYGKPGWHYSDEDNFEERKERAAKFLSYLTSLNKNNLLVVAHGGILRIIMCVMIFGRDLTPQEDRKLFTFLHSSNAGVTLCEFTENKWKLITWNDLAHLAE